MKNINRLAHHITKYGSENIMIHTIPKTNNWIICSKIEINKWFLTLCDPMGNVTYNLGTATDAQHLNLWEQITRMEIERQISQIQLAKQLKNKIYYFIKNYENTYKKFIKVETKTKEKNKKPSKKSKNNKRTKSINS